jgi:predicted small secreted protein
MNIRNSSLVVALAIVGGLALTACNGTSSGAGGSDSSSGTPTPTASAADGSATGATPAGAGTTTSAAGGGGAARCHTANLGFAWGAPGPSASGGRRSVAVKLTNKAGATCTMYGFPGVDLVNSGQSWSLPRATDVTPRTVTLVPGATATFTLVYRAYEGAGGQKYTPTTAIITPPDETTSYDLPWSYGSLMKDSTTSISPVG